MTNFSKEQKEIVRQLTEKHSVIVDAVAGSGKTTTVELLAKSFPTTQILVLLYNRFLAKESQKKITNPFVEIKTIHSYAQRTYGVQCNKDDGLERILSEKIRPSFSHLPQIIVIDESQDLRPLLVKIIRKVIMDLKLINIRPTLLIMGDYRQCIYRYLGSDERFLINADRFYSDLTDLPFVRLNLSHTFRCTKNIVQFINQCMLHQERFASAEREGPKVQYIVENIWAVGPTILSLIKYFIDGGHTPADIAILSYSIRKEKSPIYELANFLTDKGYNIFKPKTDDEELFDSQLMENKIVLSTIHQFKGRERPMVIVLGFDEGHFQYWEREADPTLCPNTLYVAATRASEMLVLIQSGDKNPLPFIDPLTVRPDFTNLNILNVKETPRPAKKEGKSRCYAVRDLANHLPYSLLCEILSRIEVFELHPSELPIRLERKINAGETVEDVSDLYGIAIPAIKEFELTGYPTAFRYLDSCLQRQEYNGLKVHQIANQIQEYKDFPNKDDFKIVHTEDFIKFINLYSSITNRFIYPLKQIRDYSWYEDSYSEIKRCLKRMDFMEKNDSFEEYIEYQTIIGGCRILAVGYIDYVQNVPAVDEKEMQEVESLTEVGITLEDVSIKEHRTLWELKCVNNLTEEHILQTLLYGILSILRGENLPMRLLNILSGQILGISLKVGERETVNDVAQDIFKKIILHKLSNESSERTLEELLHECEIA